jgi:serine/threonine protein kinase
MSDLQELLKKHQHGSLSFADLLAELKTENYQRSEVNRLLETLSNFQQSTPLPDETFLQLRQVILSTGPEDATEAGTELPDSLMGDDVTTIHSTQHVDDATVINTQITPPKEDKTEINTGISSLDDATRIDTSHAPAEDTDKTTLNTQIREPAFLADQGTSSEPDKTTIASTAQTELDVDGTIVNEFVPDTRFETTEFTPEVSESVNKESFGNKQVIKDRFILENIIGQGGMGTVYRARDLRKEEAEDPNPFVALKIMNEDFKRHPDAFKAMQRETQKSQNLAHPNIITVFDFDKDRDEVYMTMELLEGETLKDFIRSHPAGVSKEEVKDIVDGICQALAYAHKNDIVHSDLKPGNVFIGKDGKVKVLDFGIARAVPRHDEEGEIQADFDAGSLGALTPSYASLEMIKRESPHPSDDIYALGVITYELLTGQHPYQRLSADKVANQALKPKPLANLKKREWNALNKSLVIPRDQRTADIQEFITEFLQPKSLRNKIIIGALTMALAASTAAFILKPEAELPPPVQELTTEQLAKIDNLLETADLYMALGQLATPPGDSALDLYNRVLEMDPFNTIAIDGKTSIANEYEKLAKTSLRNGDRTTATAYADTGLLALPTHEGLKTLKQQLESL